MPEVYRIVKLDDETRAFLRSRATVAEVTGDFDPSHKPSSREARVRRRDRNWRTQTWPTKVEVSFDESVIREPLTKEELWARLTTHR